MSQAALASDAGAQDTLKAKVFLVCCWGRKNKYYPWRNKGGEETL